MMPAKKLCRATCWRMPNDFVGFQRFLCLLSCGLFVFFTLSAASLRRFTWIDECDEERVVRGEGSRGSYFYSILSFKCVFFSILAQLNFANGGTKHDNVKVRILKASMNVGNLVSFSRYRSYRWSYAPHWPFRLRRSSQYKTRNSSSVKPILASSQPARNSLKCASCTSLIYDLFISNACLLLSSSCTTCLKLGRKRKWLKRSERVGGTAGADVSLDKGNSSSDFKIAFGRVLQHISRVKERRVKRWVVCTTPDLLWVTRRWHQIGSRKNRSQLARFLDLYVSRCVRLDFPIASKSFSICRLKCVTDVLIKPEFRWIRR